MHGVQVVVEFEAIQHCQEARHRIGTPVVAAVRVHDYEHLVCPVGRLVRITTTRGRGDQLRQDVETPQPPEVAETLAAVQDFRDAAFLAPYYVSWTACSVFRSAAPPRNLDEIRRLLDQLAEFQLQLVQLYYLFLKTYQ